MASRVVIRELTDTMEEATFSISRLGMAGVKNFVAVLRLPKAASIAVTAIRDAPVVEDGAAPVGRRIGVTMFCHLRGLEGVQAVQLPKNVTGFVEQPQAFVSGDAFA